MFQQTAKSISRSSQDMLQVSTTSVDTSRKSSRGAQRDFVDRVLWPLVPHQPYNFCELVDVLQLTLKCSSQALAVQRWAAVGWYPRPFIFNEEANFQIKSHSIFICIRII